MKIGYIAPLERTTFTYISSYLHVAPLEQKLPCYQSDLLKSIETLPKTPLAILFNESRKSLPKIFFFAPEGQNVNRNCREKWSQSSRGSLPRSIAGRNQI
jgi:hypothetical protein